MLSSHFHLQITQIYLKPSQFWFSIDSGAIICIAVTQHLPEFNIDERNLLQCNKTINAVSRSIDIMEWIPIKFTINSNTTQQPLYSCDKVDKIYLSCQLIFIHSWIYAICTTCTNPYNIALERERNTQPQQRCSHPTSIYLFKDNNRNTKTRCEICSKLTIKTPERPYWHCSGVFIVIFGHI